MPGVDPHVPHIFYGLNTGKVGMTGLSGMALGATQIRGPGSVLARCLRQVLSQLRRDRSLSQSVCLALSSIEPSS